jgi:hypothetical protein
MSRQKMSSIVIDLINKNLEQIRTINEQCTDEYRTLMILNTDDKNMQWDCLTVGRTTNRFHIDIID